MKKKILIVPLLLLPSLSFANDPVVSEPEVCQKEKTLQMPDQNSKPEDITKYRELKAIYSQECAAAKAQADTARRNQPDSQLTAALSDGSTSKRCKEGLKVWRATPDDQKQKPTPDDIIICEQLEKLSAVANTGHGAEPLDSIDLRETVIVSTDGQIKCKAPATFTMDYESCKNAVMLYDAVFVAEKAMDMQQKIRTDVKGVNLNKDAQKKAAEGDVQGAALDGQMAMQKHMEGINKEKVLTYIAATGALMKAWWAIPGEKQVAQRCLELGGEKPQLCEKTVKKSGILANKEAKAALQIANAAFAAKAMAAQLALKQNQNNQKTIAKVKNPFETEAEDVMFERCQFNPADPACIEAGNRIRGEGVNFGSGNFDLGGGGSNNAFDLSPEGPAFGEVGAESTLDDKNEVASINNPFVDAAKDAQGILNPAGAAQTQATGGAGGGGGGGAGGGMGGGGASLGSDLSGENKDANKEAQIKAGKVSGTYGAAGGGGYKGIAKSKGDKNPFASLFDKKSEGGVVEDRSLASSDIDGKASGLFQKISKRYNKIHADKRIEANNLE